MPAGALGLALTLGIAAGPRAALAYVVLGLGGWVSLTIVGVMLKIVPFLGGTASTRRTLAANRCLTLAQLSWPAAQRLAYAGLTGGVLALASAVAAGAPAAIEAAGVGVAVGALAFAAARAGPCSTSCATRRPAIPRQCRPRHDVGMRS